MTGPGRVPTPPRSPWQRLYGAVHRTRWRWYAGRARRLARPVISVGNLHWGGAGKTPMVAAVAQHLSNRGKRVTILSRGYGRRSTGVQVVSTGEGPLLGPLVAGDEPVLLAGELPGVGVVVGEDRFQAGTLALQHLEPPPEVFLLDDGFSHLGLFRDIDVVVFPANDPLAGGRLLPSGRLREPLASLDRADAAVLMGAEPAEAKFLAGVLRPFGFQGSMFACSIEARPARLVNGDLVEPGVRVLAVAAIAHPYRLVDAARQQGFRIADVLTFGDHHGYPSRSLQKIEKVYRRTAAEVVLTTSKDRVKLLGRLHLPLAELPIRAHPEASLWRWLDKRLEQQIAEMES